MHVTMQIFVIVFVVVVFVVSCNWFFPANHKSVSVLFLFTCILYCIAFLLLHEAFLRTRIPSTNKLLLLDMLITLGEGVSCRECVSTLYVRLTSQ